MINEITRENIRELFAAAIENGDIRVYYQPKYDALTGRLAGAEALSRWLDGKTVIPPFLFIPLLEENGDINKLDWYVLEKTCKLLKRMKDENIPRVPISVNFSRLHTIEDDFAKYFKDTVKKFDISRKYIEAEITENALEQGGRNIFELISALREEGISVSIDDFGSGLSSLSFVKDASANVLKIDKSLLSSNCENEKERIVLESIFSFAQRLNMTTVAEGVETKEQLGFLRTCGCTLIQGFLFAKPMPEEEFYELCKSVKNEDAGIDILETQPLATANQLLLDAVFQHFPLTIMCNLTRDSYYTMAYSNFTTQSCASTGVYSEVILHASKTMHPDDVKKFYDTFDVPHQLECYKRGDKSISVITRQLGDDGVYRRVETTNYFVKNPAVDDVLAITLARPLEVWTPEEQ